MTTSRLLLSCLFAAALLLTAQALSAAALEAGDVEAGGKIAAQHCAACHMPKGAPIALPGKTPPPPFKDVANAENLFETVTAALDNPKHPMRQITLQEQQIADVTAFIRTVK